MGSERIGEILSCVNKEEKCEITIEANPGHLGRENCSFDFELLQRSGVNRVSLGLQSAVNSERKSLGRVAGVNEAARAIERLKEAGIDNISLDLMLGVPGQTKESLDRSLDFCINAGIKHISAYILKIEEGTPYEKLAPQLNLPGEDEACNFYLYTCEELEKADFMQYEISNFALPGYESRHNLKYWKGEEYLGLGPAAHSFIGGRRFYFERDINAFLSGCEPIPDGPGGGSDEFIMLSLRLTEGLKFEDYYKKFGTPFPEKAIEKAREYEKHGLTLVTNDGISLTKKGFLLSNSIIAELI